MYTASIAASTQCAVIAAASEPEFTSRKSGYANTTKQPRIVVTGRINERGAQLVYYHRMDDQTVAILKASPEFYLKEIDALAKGRLPDTYDVVRTFPYTYRAITEADLLSKAG